MTPIKTLYVGLCWISRTGEFPSVKEITFVLKDKTEYKINIKAFRIQI